MPSNDSLSEEEFLANYDASHYPKPSVTVDTVIFRENDGKKQVLLIKRGNHPYRGSWALPGGFLNMEEELAVAAAREVREETALAITALEEIGVYGAVGRDKRDRVLTVAYVAVVGNEMSAQAGDDAAECAWFDLSWQLSADELKIELAKGADLLQVRSQIEQSTYSGNIKASALLMNDLAFDHGLILADAIMRQKGVMPNAQG